MPVPLEPAPAYPTSAYDAPPPPAPAPAAVPSVLGTAARPSSSRRTPAEDPQADRVVLLPTAYTHPAGTVFFSSYDVLLLQAGYAFTDSTQLSLTALPIPSESFTVLDVTLKTALLSSGPVRVAALGSASGGIGKEVGVLFIGRAGGVAQLCVEPRCDSSFTLSSNLVLAGALLMANGAGAIWRVGRTLSLLGELATLVPIGSQAGEFNGATLGGGVRLHYTNWGFDLALVRSLASKGATLPLVSATYRSAP